MDEFTGGRERRYAIRVESGQHLRVEIVPGGDLDTWGRVQHLNKRGVPSAPPIASGGPGGVVFDQDLPQTGVPGDYTLEIGQRFNEKQRGCFGVLLSLTMRDGK